MRPYEIQSACGRGGPLLSLTARDRADRRLLLDEPGVPRDAWFACVHARKDGYAPNEGQGYWNSKIEDCSPAIATLLDRVGRGFLRKHADLLA